MRLTDLHPAWPETQIDGTPWPTADPLATADGILTLHADGTVTREPWRDNHGEVGP